MSGSTYAIFQAGQTLTHDELNLGIDFLDRETQRLGRVVGFGISCGLDGRMDATRLTIDPGRALDQIGRPMEVGVAAFAPTEKAPAQLHLGLAPQFELASGEPVGAAGSALLDERFDFVEPTDGGYTAILRILETDEVAPPCPEDGCDKQATIRCREAEIVFVKGRLITSPPDPDRITLLDIGPIDIGPNGKLRSPAAALRNELGRILSAAGLSSDAKAVLNGLSFTAGVTDLVKAQRAGLLNRLLFFTIEFLLCRESMARACVHETATPGVALGWLEDRSGAWKWHCGYRHDWMTPLRELADGFLARPCEDPCTRLFDRIETEILTFVEIPETTPPEEGEPGGGSIPCYRCTDSDVPRRTPLDP